ncbi:MAG: glycosyltransferase [Bacillota bacterium]|nr:glycosyltransferase [Bacillota bacterium]
MNIDQESISLCMIVKNEEKMLGNCLKSCQGLVDEIIIVDTGSQDATVEIARAYGAKIYHFPWQDDFSQARNVSLQHASKEWVLILDADEELAPETEARLKELSANTKVAGWTFTILSPLSSSPDSQLIKHQNLRMFRNEKNYRFTGTVHEQIHPALLQDNAIIQHSNLPILHHGYEYNLENRKEKTLRNIRLLKKALDSNPDDTFYNYNLGISYYRLGKLDQARSHYRLALQKLDYAAAFASSVFRDYSICLTELGEYEEALEVVSRGIAYYSDYPDLYFQQGIVFFDTGILGSAKSSFLRCTRFQKILPEYLSTEGINSYLAYQNLAEISEEEGQLEEACDYTRRALMEKPSSQLILRLCKLLNKRGLTGDEVRYQLGEFLPLDDLAIASLLFEQQYYDTCYELLKQGDSEDIEIQSLKLKCLQSLKGNDEMKQNLLQIESPSFTAEILKEQCIARWEQEPRQDASPLIVSFPGQEDPVVFACSYINKLIFPGDNNIFKLPDIQDYSDHLLDIAINILELGDKDLSVALVEALTNQNRGEAYYLLGKYAVQKGLYRKAKTLLERSINYCQATVDAYYQLGIACAGINLHDRAFMYFLQASQESNDERYISCALVELATHLMQSLQKLLNKNAGDVNLRRQLFYMASIKSKSERLKKMYLLSVDDSDEQYHYENGSGGNV